MRVDTFAYHLPTDRIAQRPRPRGTSRLLVVDRSGEERHQRVSDLPELLKPGDLLVVNDTRVLPARLRGRRPSGGRAEVLLVEERSPTCWEALVRPARKCPSGTRVRFADDLEAEVVEAAAEGRRVLLFSGPLDDVLERLGEVPLPPYIRRPPDAADRERYQTVYARRPGAVAAPTAGLHFTAELLATLEARGVDRASLTLHVGPGTFRPVSAERVEDHRMESERFTLPQATAAAVARTRLRGGRVVAVGTTVVRALEAAAEGGALRPGSARTDLFIYPGFRFQVVDVLLTNFHLPRSSLLMLVCAFAGTERTLAAYREAVERGYRFYSYGDAMLAGHQDV
jgi:S-adenosylmethionine:tRNA ribosyltransferase-isomerase